MQSIQTKYIGATGYKGSQIEAKAWRGKIRIPYPHELSGDEVHRAAVRALLEKIISEDEKTGTPRACNPWNREFSTGTLADGKTLVHVLDHDGPSARLVACAPDMLEALQRLVHPMADDSDLEHAREVIARATGEEVPA